MIEQQHLVWPSSSNTCAAGVIKVVKQQHLVAFLMRDTVLSNLIDEVHQITTTMDGKATKRAQWTNAARRIVRITPTLHRTP
eukprot:scaffold100183_cov22-Tisochrysis_lutea.AAC.3